MTKELKAEVIAIGTELLLGQIANTNAQWLSNQLASHGINTYYHTVVGDNLERVVRIFQAAESRSNVIIVSGGLGPTEDDMTREAFQEMANFEMEEYKPAMEKIQAAYDKQQTTMTSNNKKQARVFKSANVIENKTGMAPGMIVSHNKKTWIFLPGVPRELEQMTTDTVIPYLIDLSGREMVIESLVMRFIGIGESKLESELADMIHQQDNPTIAPLAQKDSVVLRLTVKETSSEKANKRLQQTKREILKKVGEFFYGEGKEKIEDTVFSLLKKEEATVAAAESLTGGMFTDRLINIPGASTVCPGGLVCYDSKMKQRVLGVSEEILSTYGAVSEACAAEMASKAKKLFNTNIGISFTGEAGPKSQENITVGTVYIGIQINNGEPVVKKFVFDGDRNMIRHRATIKGYELLFNYLKTQN